MEESSLDSQVSELLKGDFARKDIIKVLGLTEDSIFADYESCMVHQGKIFQKEAETTENIDLKFTFLLSSVECFSVNIASSLLCVYPLFDLGFLLGSSSYYKKSVEKAKVYLALMAYVPDLNKNQSNIETLIKTAESRIANAKSLGCFPVEKCEPKDRNSDRMEKAFDQRLRLYWTDLNAEKKRDFLKVSIARFTGYVWELYGSKGFDALDQVLTFAWENKKWRIWVCRSCSKKFFSPEDCKNHFEQEHDAAFNPSFPKDMAQRISKVWVRKITLGGWEPLDGVAAVGMIKNRLEDVKAFSYVNGWSKDWPLAEDEEERSKLLQEMKLLLVSFCDQKILSCSIREWVLHFVAKHLKVSKQSLTESHLMETPQSICFLECCELGQIMDFLRKIKCERDDGTYLVSRAVENYSNGARVKEKIDFDTQFSFLLMDKRLLHCKIARFDDEGAINVSDPNLHYSKAQSQGEDILSWFFENSSEDESFQFPTPIRSHNLDIWLAVLRVVQFTCRTLGAKYAKKLQLLQYDEALTEANKLCIRDDEKRKNLPKDQWNKYASLLCNRCAERDATKLFVCAVRDVLKGALHPTFDIPDLGDCLNAIREHKNLSDDTVLESINVLKLAITNKVLYDQNQKI